MTVDTDQDVVMGMDWGQVDPNATITFLNENGEQRTQEAHPVRMTWSTDPSPAIDFGRIVDRYRLHTDMGFNQPARRRSAHWDPGNGNTGIFQYDTPRHRTYEQTWRDYQRLLDRQIEREGNPRMIVNYDQDTPRERRTIRATNRQGMREPDPRCRIPGKYEERLRQYTGAA